MNRIKINNKIAGYRKMMGKTQKDLADLFEISTQAYSSKERGKTQFKDSEKSLFRKELQKLFPNITIDEIFFEEK